MPLKPSLWLGNNMLTVTESNSSLPCRFKLCHQCRRHVSTNPKNLTAQQVQLHPQQVPRNLWLKGFGQTAVGAVRGCLVVLNAVSKAVWQQVRSVPPAPMRSMVASCTKPPKALPTQTNEATIVSTKTKTNPCRDFTAAMAMASMPQAYIPGRSMVDRGVPPTTVRCGGSGTVELLSIMVQWVFKIMVQRYPRPCLGAAVGWVFTFKP